MVTAGVAAERLAPPSARQPVTLRCAPMARGRRRRHPCRGPVRLGGDCAPCRKAGRAGVQNAPTVSSLTGVIGRSGGCAARAPGRGRRCPGARSRSSRRRCTPRGSGCRRRARRPGRSRNRSCHAGPARGCR